MLLSSCGKVGTGFCNNVLGLNHTGELALS
jgi:hypothetical protein